MSCLVGNLTRQELAAVCGQFPYACKAAIVVAWDAVPLSDSDTRPDIELDAVTGNIGLELDVDKLYIQL